MGGLRISYIWGLHGYGAGPMAPIASQPMAPTCVESSEWLQRVPSHQNYMRPVWRLPWPGSRGVRGLCTHSTGVPRSSNTTPSEEPTVGLYLGPCGSPRGSLYTLYMHDRLVVDWLNGISFETLGGVPREQKIFKGHLPRVMYHQVY